MNFGTHIKGKNVSISCDEEQLIPIKKLAITYKIEMEKNMTREDNDSWELLIPIHKIDETKVDVNLICVKFTQRDTIISRLILRINDDFVFTDEDGEEESITLFDTIVAEVFGSLSIDNYVIAILISQYLFQHLKLDDTKLVLKKDERKQLELSIFSCDNVKMCMEMDECCVCQVPTTIKTICHHPICLRCRQQIKEGRDDNSFPITPCPICRKDISRED